MNTMIKLIPGKLYKVKDYTHLYEKRFKDSDSIFEMLQKRSCPVLQVIQGSFVLYLSREKKQEKDVFKSQEKFYDVYVHKFLGPHGKVMELYTYTDDENCNIILRACLELLWL